MISVVVPTCNRNEMLAKCLQKLAPGMQQLPFNEYEVIVSDDGETETAEHLVRDQFPWAIWVAGPANGPAANRNNGAKYAQGEWLAFTDDDCLPDYQWLYGYLDAIKNNSGIKVFEGKTYADRPRRSLAEFAPINENGGVLPSCNFMIKKSLFHELHGFDEEYTFSFEDMDFHHRLKRKNYLIHFTQGACVCHPWRILSNKKIWKAFHAQKRGIQVFVKKHPEVLHYYNSIHFIKEASKNFALDTLPDIIRFKGAGTYCVLVWRYLEVSMGVFLLPATVRFFINNFFRK